MKNYLGTISVLACVLLVSCEKKTKPPIVRPEKIPPPTSTPTPTATPTVTPVPTPQARLAPPGTYFVIKNFSVRGEDGLHGFPPGKKVTLVQDDVVDFVVTDGIVEGRAPKDSFTNDLDVVDALVEKAAKAHNAAQQTRTEQRQSQTQQQTSQSDAISKDLEERRKQQLAASIGSLRQQSSALAKRIGDAANERLQNGYPMNGGPRSNSGQARGHVTSLSADASQIESLIQAQTQIETQIRQLEAKR